MPLYNQVNMLVVLQTSGNIVCSKWLPKADMWNVVKDACGAQAAFPIVSNVNAWQHGINDLVTAFWHGCLTLLYVRRWIGNMCLCCPDLRNLTLNNDDHPNTHIGVLLLG